MKPTILRSLAVAGFLAMILLTFPPSLSNTGTNVTVDSILPPDGDESPPGTSLGLPFNLTNDYQKIWEPNNIQGSSHAVATSPTNDLVVVAGGYVSDREIHIYRWNEAARQYVHVWDSGDQIFRGDVMDVAFMDSDNNGYLEVVAGSADGTIYVFEARGPEDGVFGLAKDANVFDLVWDSGTILDRQVWSVVATDIDHDSHAEIIVGVWDSRVYVFDYVTDAGWPYCDVHWMEFELVWHSGDAIKGRVNSVAVGDTDSDGNSEIVAGAQDGKVYLFEAKECCENKYELKWNSTDAMYRPVNSVAVSNNLDSDPYGEIVASAYGQGVFVFEYISTTGDFMTRKFNRMLEPWETGIVSTLGLYTGYEADYYVDKKSYGWEEQGIFEYDYVPYPWNVTPIGGYSAMGGPPDLNVTTFDSTEIFSIVGLWDLSVHGSILAYAAESDSHGNIYVSDIMTDKILKFTPLGKLIDTWGGSGTDPGLFDRPNGLAIDRFDNIYVADYGNNRIQKFTSSGLSLDVWGVNGTGPGEFLGPFEIAVDHENDSLLIVELLNSRVQRLTLDGGFMDMWGENGSALGQFYQPTDVGIDTLGNVYIADSGNDRIQKMERDGTPIIEWGGTGTGPGEFDLPGGLAIDSGDHVYVTDFGLSRIQKFSSSGVLISGFGGPGSMPGQFFGPRGIIVRPDDSIVITDTTNRRLQFLALQEATLLDIIGEDGSGDALLSDPFDVAFGPDGSLYVTDRAERKVKVFSADGTFLRSWNVTYQPSSVDRPLGIDVDPDGFVYVVSFDHPAVIKFDSFGNNVTQWGSSGSGNGQFNVSTDIVYHDGLVYVVDALNDRVQVFTPNGTFVRIIGGPGAGLGHLSLPFGAAISPDGYLYVTELGNDRVHKFLLDGAPIGFFPTYTDPVLIAVDDVGSVYVTFSGAPRVVKYTADGIFTFEVSGNIGTYLTPRTMGLPSGLDVHPDGSLYLGLYAEGAVLKFGLSYATDNKAEAVVDFGMYEEGGGDATSVFDLYLVIPVMQTDLANFEFAISQDSEYFLPIGSEHIARIHGFSGGYGEVEFVLINVDDALRAAHWEKFRYLRIGVKGGAIYPIDAIVTRLARPIDTALVVTTGHVNTTHPGDALEEILIGTSDGQLIATTSTGAIIWQSGIDTPRFSLDSAIRDIVQLDGRGMMPTWDFDETLLDGTDIAGAGFSFTRFLSYSLVDIDGSSAHDLVVTVLSSGFAQLLYFRNTGTDVSPVFTYVSNFFASRTTPNLHSAVATYLFAAVTFADLDADGDDDIVLTGYLYFDGPIRDIRYFRQVSADNWQEVSSQFTGIESFVTSGEFVPRVSFADMDGDGDLDLTMGLDELYYFRQDGSGTSFVWTWFSQFYNGVNEEMRSSEIIGKVAFHDFDHDGDLDLTIAHAYDNYTNDGLKSATSRLSYFENTGTRNIPVWIKDRSMYDPDFRGSELTTDRGYMGPDMKDMSGDSVPDLIALQDDQIDLYTAVITHDTFMVATYPYAHMVEVEKRGPSGYYGYEAHDSWDNSVVFRGWTQSVEFADIDGDGIGETIVGSFDFNIINFEAISNFTYRRSWRSPDLWNELTVFPVDVILFNDVADMALGDQDDDGRKEIIAVAGPEILVFEAVADDTYELAWHSEPLLIWSDPSHVKPPTMLRPTVVTVDKDLDEDGHREIIVGAGSYLLIYENTADNMYNQTFSHVYASRSKDPQPVIQDIETEDFDLDGFKNIAVIGNDISSSVDGDVLSSTGWMDVWENDKNASDGSHLNNSHSIVWQRIMEQYTYVLEVADNDYNAYPELFVGTRFGLSIFERTADNTYTELQRLFRNTPVSEVRAGNTDRDSFEELMIGVGRQVMVLEQNLTLPASDHEYEIVWVSNELRGPVTDIETGDTNRNTLLEIVVTAAMGNLYSFEWVSNVTVTPTAGLASFESSVPEASDSAIVVASPGQLMAIVSEMESRANLVSQRRSES